MVIKHLSLHTLRKVIHDGSLASLQNRGSWLGWVGSQRQQWCQTVEPSSYSFKHQLSEQITAPVHSPSVNSPSNYLIPILYLFID